MAERFHILLLNGRHLNLLGTRESKKCRITMFAEIVSGLERQAQSLNVHFFHVKPNAEHVLIGAIYHTRGNTDFILINPMAFTHNRLALRDAFLAVKIPFIEICLSNVHARKPVCHYYYLSDVAVWVIFGLSADEYDYAL
ncbi:MAG: type II 3-dehydroquinate dehydratase [Candidatus Malihini olakiniferum]